MAEKDSVDLGALQTFIERHFNRLERQIASLYGQVMMMRSDLDEALDLRRRVDRGR